MIDSIAAYITAQPIEVAGVIFTLICVGLNMQANIWAWFFAIISTLCYIYTFWQARLIGDVCLNIFFLVMSLYGWWHWYFGKAAGTAELPVTRGSARDLLAWLFAGGVGAVVLGWLFSLYPSASLPYIDAIPTSYSIIGQWLLARKRVENWLFWLLVNTVAVGIYFYKDLTATGILYILLWIMALKGYYDWQAMYRAQKQHIAT